MEGINQRNAIVDKLLRKIKRDYGEAKDYYLRILQTYDLQSESVMQKLSIYNIVMNWVKDKLIDEDCRFFRLASESYPNGKAIFWVDKECVEILLNGDTNLINRITINVLTKEKSVTDAMMWLCTISETNISDSLIPAIDVFGYKNIFGKFSKNT